MSTRPLHPGQETILELPYSEVCMHLGVAGTRMRARLEPNAMVQLLDADGRAFSFPITAAEAGLDHDQDGWSSLVTDPLAPLRRPPGPARRPAPSRPTHRRPRAPGHPGGDQRAAGGCGPAHLAGRGDRRASRAAVLASNPRLPVGPQP